MHTTTIGVEGQLYDCHHNGDYSGDVIIFKRDDVASEVQVPFELMLELVGNMLTSRFTERMEQMTGKEFLMKVFTS